MKIIKLIIVLALFAAGGGIYYKLNVQGKEKTDDARFESDVVAVSSKVSGYVKALHVEDNQTVKEGDLLVTIEPVDYAIAVSKAEAELNAAVAKFEQATQNLSATRVSAPSSIAAAEAAVAAAEADFDRAQKDAKRMEGLKNVSASTRDIEQAHAAEKVAEARLNEARAQLQSAQTASQTIASADAGTRMLAAEVEGKKAELATAKEHLADTMIIAPLGGKVTNRTVQAGAFIQPGQALMAVSSPALWVVADFKETQLEHIRAGQAVDIHVDAYPKLKLAGKVESIQAGTGARLSLFPPENATGNFVKVVQRVPVKITIDAVPEGLALAPGMSVEATVHVK